MDTGFLNSIYIGNVKSMVTAIKDGDWKTVVFLLKSGVSPNQCFENSMGTYSFLFFATEYGRLKIAQLLVKRGALVQALAFDGCNCLVNASR
jgi:hypothetical protein